MPVERAASGTSLVDVLDRVLDKGIVIDAWVRVSLVGIDLITVEARVVVASIDTYLKYAEVVGQVPPASRSLLGPQAMEVTTAKTTVVRVPADVARRRVARAREPRSGAQFTVCRLAAETRLTLTEFLLGCEDVVACAQYGLDWLEQHAGISRALCAVSVSGDPDLSGVAGIGISAARTGAFEIDPLGGIRCRRLFAPGRRRGSGRTFAPGDAARQPSLPCDPASLRTPAARARIAPRRRDCTGGPIAC